MELKPLKGIDTVEFGNSLAQLEAAWGESVPFDIGADLDDEAPLVMHFPGVDISAFFINNSTESVNEFEIYSSEALLEGIKPFELRYPVLCNWLKQKGWTFEEERHDWGEKRVGVEERGVDFYFENEKLVAINLYMP